CTTNQGNPPLTPAPAAPPAANKDPAPTAVRPRPVRRSRRHCHDHADRVHSCELPAEEWARR
ncbi:hypothetical protein ACFWWX_22790, partial [Streptomyces niveus]